MKSALIIYVPDKDRPSQWVERVVKPALPPMGFTSKPTVERT